MKANHEVYVVGLMSGTSLDGLDMAYCRFCISGTPVAPRVESYGVIAAETVPYDDDWRRRLAGLDTATAYEYALANAELGHYFGKCVAGFCQRHKGRVDVVASHGHTVFHQPRLGLTAQIADIDAIAAECGLPVIGAFRTRDVALGGQGAPLVPIGDRLLFGGQDACLNLGGFSNISFERRGRRVAFDVSPCNMPLNRLAALLSLPYDADGANAAAGKLCNKLLSQLNALPYYATPAPKSLGKEWYLSDFAPLLQDALDAGAPVCDLLSTVVEHVAMQVAAVVADNDVKSLLVTGGGACNTFLMHRMRQRCVGCNITVPDKLVVDYKEALIFALLGALRLLGYNNTLASVTGASVDSCGGLLSGAVPADL